MPTDTLAFFTALFGAMPEGARVLIWTLPDKYSHWCDSPERAAEKALAVADGRDVYFGLGLADQDYGPGLRCKADSIVAIPGLWADIDIAGPAHKKGKLPPTREDALRLIELTEMPPTAVVHSGHGIQAFWLLHDLWVFDGDRERATTLSRRWNARLRLLAKSRGWDVDSTFDLARIFRVPGTMNRKQKGQPVPVEIISWDDSYRYSVEEIEALLGEPDPLEEGLFGKSGPAGRSAAEMGIVISDDLNLDPNAKVDSELIDMLCEVDSQFKSTWERTRADFQDDSQSSYDLALANAAAVAGWPDQVIVDLLIQHRRTYQPGSLEKKLRHRTYYPDTVAKAKAYAAQRDLPREGGKSFTERTQATVDDSFTLDPNAGYDSDAFEALCQVDPRFKKTWARDRPDFTRQEQYDYSLANAAILGGWSDQQVVDLIIHHRRLGEERLKLDPGYYRTVLLKARQSARREESKDTLARIATDEDELKRVAEEEPLRRKALDSLRDVLGIAISRIVRYPGTRIKYELYIDGYGGIGLGEVSGLTDQRTLRNKIASLTGQLIPRWKDENWDEIARVLLGACETVDLGEDASEEGEFRMRLKAYLGENLRGDPITLPVPIDARLGGAPFRYVKDDECHIAIRPDAYQKWMKLCFMESVEHGDILRLLKKIGARPHVVSARPADGGTRNTTMSVWRLPAEFDPDL